LLSCLLASSAPCIGQAAEPSEPARSIIAVEEIAASARANDIQPFEMVAGLFAKERKELIGKLLDILQDLRSSGLNRCSAAYYLGELRASEAVPALAAHIGLDLTGVLIKHLPLFGGSPAMDALIKIGCPSIPAVVRNLADSDSGIIRDRSLKVLRAVEGDTEISRLRLRRAMEAEQDPAKKARLLAAADELSAQNNR
jgi:hypothetical protein